MMSGEAANALSSLLASPKPLIVLSETVHLSSPSSGARCQDFTWALEGSLGGCGQPLLESQSQHPTIMVRESNLFSCGSTKNEVERERTVTFPENSAAA